MRHFYRKAKIEDSLAGSAIFGSWTTRYRMRRGSRERL